MNRAAILARPAIKLSPAETEAMQRLNLQGATFRHDVNGKLIGVEAVGQTITDEITLPLQSLKSIRHLSLVFTQVTGRGIGRLSNLFELDAIDLGGSTQIDDEGARSVARLFGLSSVSVWDTAITDAGAKLLAELPRLKYLYISGTRITDTGLGHLCQLKRLTGLDIHATKITDKGLAHVAKMTNLEWLDLSFTNITDKSLVHLEKLTSLQRLHLKHTEVSALAIYKLRQKLPHCRVLLAA